MLRIVEERALRTDDAGEVERVVVVVGLDGEAAEEQEGEGEGEAEEEKEVVRVGSGCGDEEGRRREERENDGIFFCLVFWVLRMNSIFDEGFCGSEIYRTWRRRGGYSKSRKGSDVTYCRQPPMVRLRRS